MHTQKTDSKLSLSSIRNDEALGYMTSAEISTHVDKNRPLGKRDRCQRPTEGRWVRSNRSHRQDRSQAEDVVSTDTLPTNGGNQTFTFVNEDGLYDVILDSRKSYEWR